MIAPPAGIPAWARRERYRPLGLLGCLLAGLSLAACAPHPFETIPADDARIRYVGRFQARGEARVGSWAATQIEARFTGPTLAVVLSEMPNPDELRDLDRIQVAIDDGPPRQFVLAEGRHVYPLARGLAEGEHRMQIWKLTEPVAGTLSFHGLLLARGHMLLSAPPAPKRRIEMIGDSITTGYGNEGPNEHCHWDAALQNSFLTYGAFAARELGADYSAIAWSGKGVLRNYDAREPETLPELYERVLPGDAASERAPTTPRPDAVIVNLGTNDLAMSIPDAATFQHAYIALLRKVRARYPGALLVIACGPMLAEDAPQPMARSLMRAWLQNIERRWREKVDAKVAFIELWTDPAEGLGCDFHPSVRTHARMGKELAVLLRARLGW